MPLPELGPGASWEAPRWLWTARHSQRERPGPRVPRHRLGRSNKRGASDVARCTAACLSLQAGPRFDLKLYQIKLGTLEQTEVENEWVLRPYMNTARKRQAL